MSERIKDEARGTITSVCPAGHSETRPDKGLGRASLATWETRHQHCRPKWESGDE